MESGTVQECVLNLLGYIGVVGFAPDNTDQSLNQPGLDDVDIQAAVSAMNAALQLVQRWSPGCFSFERRSLNFNAPASVLVNVIAGQGLTFVVAPPSYFVGCSIQISGDDDLNEIRDISGSDASLLHGYRGQTANGISAVVYHDCIQMDDDVRAVIHPVSTAPNRVLEYVESREIFDRLSYQINQGGTPPSLNQKQTGQPTIYIVESRTDKRLFLRLNPMPAAAGTVTYQLSIRPERVSRDGLAEDGGEDPGVIFTTLSLDLIDSVLMPIARKKFSVNPSFHNREARSAINDEYIEVMKELKRGQRFDNQVAPVPTRYFG